MAQVLAINPLSNAKGTSRECELCGKPAHLQCKNCRVTFYCDMEHQQLDYKGIHQQICNMLPPLRAPVPILGSDEERLNRNEKTKAQQISLFNISKKQATRLLFEGKYSLAIPAALEALKFSITCYGSNSIEIVPSYLLLGEASIGLKQYKEAEDYLSLGKWAILKASNCQNFLRSQLHRKFGQLYAAQGFYDIAVEELALDIYFMSLDNGPEDIAVTGGYYQIGLVFEKLHKEEKAMSFFAKCVQLWRHFFKKKEQFDTSRAAEAIQMLEYIHSYRLKKNESGVLAAETVFVLAQVYNVLGNIEKAHELAKTCTEGSSY